MANRDEISATIDIEAPPERVWELVSDPAQMPRWSPQCRKTIVRGKGPVGVGTTTVNINRRGPLFWPTRSKVVEFVPAKRFAFSIAENGTVWSYDLEATATGTRLTESRHAPHGVSALSNFLTSRVLGGTDNFESELEDGIRQTLDRIKAAAEGGVPPGKA
ncbi:SRPBCC family protein [Aeromicrobium sp. 636]|uniref:SRPBCC family protein n=1 Tax=Aeromicrobium senzhongii TaxID=2663859 RepID=A0A8I0EV27_9ACTN|nr:SRPBCC family protein [Aeromicrobium sp. 636]MBC9225913.1 SRPBCC family protein [Aeromicrobium senzhongii]MCQ3998020.1 SRPBCC family protein [Aeromicrobium sp. 636]